MELPKPDFYLTVHKGLRWLAFDMLKLAGALDWASDDGLERWRAEGVPVLEQLLVHAVVEDQVFHPAIEQLEHGITEPFESAHKARGREFQEIRGLLNELSAPGCAPERRRELGAKVYSLLVTEVAMDLEHLAQEEADLAPVLMRSLSAAELDALNRRAERLMTLGQSALLYGAMLVACNARERERIAADLHARGEPLRGAVVERMRRQGWMDLVDPALLSAP